MKYMLLTLIAFFISVIIFADNIDTLKNNDILKELPPQQSTVGKYRPENVSKGITDSSSRTQIIISSIPSYLWQHGCGPTALGMVIGYYDSMGFSDLISGSASSQNSIVNDAIANSEHYSDYSQPIDYYPNLYTDLSELGGAHTSNCIADFMETSWSSEENRYGWSWSNMVNMAFINYVQMCNSEYITNTNYNWFSGSSWDIYKNEINNNRPVVLLVDSDGNGGTDHFVTGIGYDDNTSTYAIYDTWDHSIHWFQWRGLSSSYSWGIYGFSLLEIECTPSIPENVEISISLNSVSISWNAVECATSYKIYSSNDPNTGFSEDTSGTLVGESWTTDITGIEKKFYFVKAVN